MNSTLERVRAAAVELGLIGESASQAGGDPAVAPPAVEETQDSPIVYVSPSSFDEALTLLPHDFAEDLLVRIETAQASAQPAVELSNIRQILVGEWERQPDVADAAAGETHEELVALCVGLVQAISFCDELLG